MIGPRQLPEAFAANSEFLSSTVPVRLAMPAKLLASVSWVSVRADAGPAQTAGRHVDAMGRREVAGDLQAVSLDFLD